MILIRQAALSTDRERWMYGDRPFTGVGVTVHEKAVTAARRYEDGMDVGTYEGEYFPLQRDVPWIDATGTAADWDLDAIVQTYDGQPFTGIAFEFVGDSCVREGLYRGGEVVNEVRRRPNGAPIRAYLSSLDSAEYYHWHGNGARDIVLIRLLPSKDSLSLHFNNHEEVTGLGLYGAYFQRLAQSHGHFRHSPVNSPHDLIQLRFASEVSIGHSAIDDELFEQLLTARRFDMTTRLRLNKVRLTPAMLRRIGTLPALKSLEVFDDANRLREAVDGLRVSCPKLTIDYHEK